MICEIREKKYLTRVYIFMVIIEWKWYFEGLIFRGKFVSIDLWIVSMRSYSYFEFELEYKLLRVMKIKVYF